MSCLEGLKIKVLIIDDEKLVRLSLERVFKKSGHIVELAEDGEVGLDKWMSFEPELVILDILMPKLNGPEVLEKMKPKSKSKVILISAYSGEYNLQKAQDIGADLFISKPFENIFDVLKQAESLFG